MNALMNVMVMAAKHMPFDRLVSDLKKAIDTYEKNPSEHTKEMVGAVALMLTVRVNTEGQTNKETLEMLDEMNRANQMAEVFKKDNLS